MADYGYAQFSAAEHARFATKVQKAWHYDSYPPAARRAILERVQRLVVRNPNGYLAKIAAEVYRNQG